jgi:hypothetical protein
MNATAAPVRKRRPHNELKSAIRGYLETVDGRTASIPQIRAATAPALGNPPQSSYRSTLQDQRYFLRVSRGVFRLIDESVDDK